MTAAEAIKVFEKLDVEQIAVESIEETKDEFIRLNEEQWKEGLTNRGLPITPEPYSKPYAKIRQKEGLQTDFIDLKRKGNLYKNVAVDSIDKSKIKLRSDVPYEKWVTKRYDNIWGLDPENIRIYQQQSLLPAMKEKVENQTGFRYV